MDNVFVQMFRLPEFKKPLALLGVEAVYPQFVITAFYVVAFILILGSENAYEKMKKFKPTFFRMAVTLFLLTWSVFTFAGISEFLYFNF